MLDCSPTDNSTLITLKDSNKSKGSREEKVSDLYKMTNKDSLWCTYFKKPTPLRSAGNSMVSHLREDNQRARDKSLWLVAISQLEGKFQIR